MSLLLTLEQGPRSQVVRQTRLDEGELVIGRSAVGVRPSGRVKVTRSRPTRVAFRRERTTRARGHL